jgi:hypothetical protein
VTGGRNTVRLSRLPGLSEDGYVAKSHKSDTETHGSVSSADHNLRSKNKANFTSVPKYSDSTVFSITK